MKKVFLSLSILALFTVIFTSCDFMDEIKPDCGCDEKDEKECFELLYPVSYLMPDGSTINCKTEKEESKLEDWYKANPKSKEEEKLVYPVKIKWYDGTVEEIADEKAMDEAKEKCDEDDDKDWDQDKDDCDRDKDDSKDDEDDDSKGGF